MRRTKNIYFVAQKLRIRDFQVFKTLKSTSFDEKAKLQKMSTSDKKLKIVFMLPDKSKKEPEEICEVVIFNSWYLINHYIKCKNYR